MQHEDMIKHAAAAIGLDAATSDRLLDAYRNISAAQANGALARDDTRHLVQLLRQAYDFNSPPLGRATAADACRAVGIESPSRGQCMAMGVALRFATQREPFKSNGRLVYVVPIKKGQHPLP